MYKVVLGFFLQLILSQFMSIIKEIRAIFQVCYCQRACGEFCFFVAYCLYEKTGILWVSDVRLDS